MSDAVYDRKAISDRDKAIENTQLHQPTYGTTKAAGETGPTPLTAPLSYTKPAPPPPPPPPPGAATPGSP